MVLNKVKPSVSFWLLLLLSATLGILLTAGSQTEERKHAEEFQQYYRVYSLSTPKTLRFAGTQIPTTDYDVAERYDKEILTNVYWQSQTLLMLKRANRFLPIIEKILVEEKIPVDFKYLALAESGLQNVVSPAGASGFWQFLDKTGKRYGLEVTEEVDERYHLEKATRAACAYFKDAFNQLGDWCLVAASYNMGIEGVKRQIRNQGLNNYADLYLNTETSRYLFRIIAIKDICEYPQRYGFQLAQSDLYQPVPVVYLKVDLSISDLAKWSLSNFCNYKLVKLLNPWLRKPFLNVPSGKQYFLALPKERIMNSELASRLRNDTLVFEDTRQGAIVGEDLITVIDHVVMRGETIENIALKYGVSTDDLLAWNELPSGFSPKPGMRLKIRKTNGE